jgi:thiamine biosynthesis lipoprotein
MAGCRLTPGAEGLRRFQFQQPHMGTLFTITLYAPDEASARGATDASFVKIAALERAMSDYDPESELMRLCGKPVGEPATVSEDLFDVLCEAQRVSELSGGAFDVTTGPLARLWRRARREKIPPSPEALAGALAAVGYEKLRLDLQRKTVTLTVPHMQLDLGGIAKGYAADRALAVLRARGLPRALVAASGDIAVGESPPGENGWRIGIGGLALEADGAPSASGRAVGEAASPLNQVLRLRNAAVSTSGDTEQFVEIGGARYSHIVHPRTGMALTERLQVTLIGRRATDTDAFATAASVLGWEGGVVLVESEPGLAGVFIRKEAGQTRIFWTKRFH